MSACPLLAKAEVYAFGVVAMLFDTAAEEGHVIAMDWREGFMDAVKLRQTDWEPFWATKQGKLWMKPIMDHLLDENFNSLSGVTENKLDAHLDRAAKKIQKTVPQVFAYWQAQHARVKPH